MATFTYELGDLIKVKDPLNRETQRILDAAGRLRNVTNPLGQKTLYTPDALDRITQLTDAINGATGFTYDANSNLLTVTDAKTQQTVYTYSTMNRVGTRKDPLLNTETYTYDNNGNVATVTDRKSQVTTYTYDPLNRRTKATYQDSTSTNYTYDTGNRITQVQEKDSGGTVTATITRTYDGLDRRSTPGGTAQRVKLDYAYDTASRRTSMTVAGQTAVMYTYDNANRLTQVGARHEYGHDRLRRRRSEDQSHLAEREQRDLCVRCGEPAHKLDVQVRCNGHWRSDVHLRSSRKSHQDRRIVCEERASARAHDGQLQREQSADDLWNQHPDVRSERQPGHRDRCRVTTTYTWNVRNQLTGISNTGFSASFTYDSFGRRTGKTVQGTDDQFCVRWAQSCAGEERRNSHSELADGLGIDEFFQRTDGVGSRALLPDALGSTVALGDNTGTLQTQYTYEPFGYVTQSGQANSSSYKYTGREDDGSGLDYYRARYYHPRLQRFVAEDPIGLEGGINYYAYSYNNPVIWKDPFGLLSWPDAEARGMTWDQWWNHPDTTMEDQLDAQMLDPNPGIRSY